MAGFRVRFPLASGAGANEEILGVASTQYTPGDMLNVVAGIATKVVGTGKGTHIFVARITPPDEVRPGTINLVGTKGELLSCIPVSGELVVLESDLKGNSAPPINGVACNANATLNLLLVTAAGSTADYNNGQCYVPEIGQQRLITDDTVTTGVHAFTVVPAFRRAPTTGDTVIAVPFSKGATTIKFSSVSPEQGIGAAVADKAGGQNKIFDVDLARLLVFSTCPDSE